VLRRDGPLSVAVIGGGPQALGHAAALEASVRTRPVEVRFLVRDPDRAAAALGPTRPTLPLGTSSADQLLRSADVVVCATSARAPVLDGSALADHVVVIAVGSHEPDAREVDAALCHRATVVVEDVTTAQREAGDVVLAIEEGALAADRLVTLRDVVTGAVEVPADQPLLFKSVGMPWEDLVVADAVFRDQTVSI
jgi:ornithine cyclodeaminase/alanine dehydrogenase-like protein (mu-crystallin family)